MLWNSNVNQKHLGIGFLSLYWSLSRRLGKAPQILHALLAHHLSNYCCCLRTLAACWVGFVVQTPIYPVHRKAIEQAQQQAWTMVQRDPPLFWQPIRQVIGILQKLWCLSQLELKCSDQSFVLGLYLHWTSSQIHITGILSWYTLFSLENAIWQSLALCHFAVHSGERMPPYFG